MSAKGNFFTRALIAFGIMAAGLTAANIFETEHVKKFRLYKAEGEPLMKKSVTMNSAGVVYGTEEVDTIAYVYKGDTLNLIR